MLLALVLFPFSTSPDTWIVIHFGHPFLLVAGLIGFVRRFFSRRPIDILEAAAALFVFSMIGTSIWSPTLFASLARSLTNLLGLGVFLGAREIGAHGDAQKTIRTWLRNALLLSGAILSAYYLINVGLAVNEYGIARVLVERFVGGVASLPWGATNVVGACLMLPLMAALTVPTRLGRWDWCAVVLIILAIVSMSSRALLAILLLLLLGLAFIDKRKGLLAAIIAAAMIAVPIGFWIAAEEGEALEFLFAERTDADSLATFNSRSDIWRLYWDRFLERGFSGVGYYGSVSSLESSGHNLIITTMVEGGLIGLVPTLLFFSAAFISALSNGGSRANRMTVLWLNREGLCFALMFLNLMVEDPQYTYIYSAYFWIFLAVLMPPPETSEPALSNVRIDIAAGGSFVEPASRCEGG